MRRGKGGKYVKNPWLSPQFISLTNIFVSLPCQISLSLLHVKSASHASISDLTVSSETYILCFFHVRFQSFFSRQIFLSFFHVKPLSLFYVRFSNVYYVKSSGFFIRQIFLSSMEKRQGNVARRRDREM